MIRRLYDSIDKSKAVSNLLGWFRTKLPARRGMMLLAAIGVTFLSLIVHILWAATGSAFLGICGFVLLHGAIIGGFFGLLLAEALGRGFGE